MAFYNCGKVSGASQPHQHIQFAELGGKDEQEASGVDKKARNSVPVEELLDRIVKDGKEEGELCFTVLYDILLTLLHNPPAVRTHSRLAFPISTLCLPFD